MIGRKSQNQLFWNQITQQPTVDRTRSDYEFWGKLRRGKADGYRIGGLFASPIGRIQSSWVLGDGFEVKAGENEDVNAALNDFVSDNIHTILEWLYDGYTLGDGVLVANPDASMTHISPDQLTIETNPLDYRIVDKYIVTTIIDAPIRFVESLTDPNFQMNLVFNNQTNTIQDIYTREKREIRVKRGENVQAVEFPNLTGMMPIIHYACEREANETNGHPVFESLLYLFARYDNAINKALDGVEVMGNPMLAIEGLEDPAQTKAANATSTSTVYEKDGTSREEPFVDPGEVAVWWLGKGASMDFKAPGQFTGDTARMLELLFYLMLQNSMIPEWTWGGAVASSKASVDGQMPAFVRAIDGWRNKIKPYLLQLFEVWIAYQRLVDPLFNAAEKVEITFPEVVPADVQALIAKLNLAAQEGLLNKEDTLRLLDIVEDPAEAVERANDEAEENMERFTQGVDSAIEQQYQAGEQQQDRVNGNGRKEPEAV